MSTIQIPLLDEILDEWKVVIGSDYAGYRNHAHRVIQFCFAIRDCNEEEQKKIIITGAFHDIGIWIEQTLDYLPPSLPPAAEYLKKEGLEDWSSEIALMIGEHHKLRPFKDPTYPLVEVFRRGDLVDFSLGRAKCGLSRRRVDEIRADLPNAGFHVGLAQKAGRWFLRHPLNPAPMMKW